MTKAKSFGLELDDDYALGLHRNAVEYNTTVEQLVHDIVTEWLDRHGEGQPFTPGPARLWPPGQVEKAEKAEAREQAKADRKELAEAEKAEVARVKAEQEAEPGE